MHTIQLLTFGLIRNIPLAAIVFAIAYPIAGYAFQALAAAKLPLVAFG